jgi:hypothetical protein
MNEELYQHTILGGRSAKDEDVKSGVLITTNGVDHSLE